MSDFLSPTTRAALNAAGEANARGDNSTRDQLIRDAYQNGTSTDQTYLNAAAITVITRRR